MFEDLMPTKGKSDVKYEWADKCPVALLLDVSYSMNGEKIEELKKGLDTLIDEMRNDEEAKQRVEVAIITFGGTVKVAHDFALAEDIKIPSLKASGGTPMGEAILKGINLVERRKKELRSQGVIYYRPWIVMITDGYPTDMKKGDSTFQKIKQKLEDGENGKHFVSWFFGTEKEADFDTLKDLHPRNMVFRLRDNKFREIFKWLSASMKIVSRSGGPGAKVDIPNPAAMSKSISLEI